MTEHTLDTFLSPFHPAPLKGRGVCFEVNFSFPEPHAKASKPPRVRSATVSRSTEAVPEGGATVAGKQQLQVYESEDEILQRVGLDPYGTGVTSRTQERGIPPSKKDQLDMYGTGLIMEGKQYVLPPFEGGCEN